MIMHRKEGDERVRRREVRGREIRAERFSNRERHFDQPNYHIRTVRVTVL
jgi:hypothetical protein